MKREYKKYGVFIIIIVFTISSVLYIVTNIDNEYEFTTAPITQEDDQSDVLLEDVGIGGDAERVNVIENETPAIETTAIQSIPIYICGAVKNPDVYYLSPTTIIKEAIIAAGGFTDDADEEVWNLAMEIQKGEKIYIPKVGEEIDKSGNSYDNRVGGNESSYKDCELININKANQQELTSLPGIGPTIAQNIIGYREANGDFKTLQDVTNVSRIGQVTLEKIKDYICFQ
ncbi:MAG TPA: competence protein ComEA [Epulopiscium sp.]|nr:competence protein ComEA [Candidatus Epulonipiscium sp.]